MNQVREEDTESQKSIANITVEGNAEQFAGRDYIKTAHIYHLQPALPTAINSIVTLSATEQLAIEEQKFRKRFKFDATQCVRRLVDCLKLERDVTDKEIRILKQTGALTFTDNQIKINDEWWKLKLALFSVVLVLLYCALYMLVTDCFAITPSGKLKAETMTAMLFIALSLATHHYFIKPHLIIQRIGAWQKSSCV